MVHWNKANDKLKRHTLQKLGGDILVAFGGEKSDVGWSKGITSLMSSSSILTARGAKQCAYLQHEK